VHRARPRDAGWGGRRGGGRSGYRRKASRARDRTARAQGAAPATPAGPPARPRRPSRAIRRRTRGGRGLNPTPSPHPSAAALLPVALAAALLAALLLRSAAAALFLATVALLTALPPGGKSQRFRHARVWDSWRRHFRLRAVVPALPYCDPGRHYMVVMVREGGGWGGGEGGERQRRGSRRHPRPSPPPQAPHSVFPMGTWLNAAITDTAAAGMPANVEAVVADVLLATPVYKHLFARVGCHSAAGSVVRRLLKDRSVAICPEGVAGIFHGATAGGEEKVYLATRLGFIKIAIQAGTPLLPVYHLGASQLLSFHGLSRLSRRVRASLGVWCGAGGTPFPHRHDIVTAVGDPVPVVQCDEPSAEQLAETHARFCAALVALFDAHKHMLGEAWETRKLRIV